MDGSAGLAPANGEAEDGQGPEGLGPQGGSGRVPAGPQWLPGQGCRRGSCEGQRRRAWPRCAWPLPSRRGCLQPQLRSRASLQVPWLCLCVCACPVGCLEGDASSLPSLSINVDQLCAQPEGHPQASDPSPVQSGHQRGEGNSGTGAVAPRATGPGPRDLLCSQGLP